MNGWEAVSQAGQNKSDWNIYKAALADQAVADGINRIRMEVHVYDENTAVIDTTSVNDNGDPFTINASGFQWNGPAGIDKQAELVNLLRARLAARGETLWVTLCYVDFRSFTFDHNTNAEEYAELIEATFLHLNSTAGWMPNAVEIILEPDAGTNQSTSHPWTAAQMAACLIATQSRLAGHGWSPRFIIPSVMRCPDAVTWYNNIKSANSNVIQYVDELSYHFYDACNSTSLSTMQSTAEADGNHIAMLEWIGADYTRLHEDLKHNAVAWEQFSLGFDAAETGDNGADYYQINHTNHTFTLSSRTKLLRQYFKWIRRGAVRKGTSTTNSNFDAVAFQNTGGNYTVVVNCLTGGSFTIGGLPAGTYHITYATASAYDQRATDQTITAGQSISTSIPAAGALTVYADATAPTPTPTPTPTPIPTPTPTPSQLQLVLESGVESNHAAVLDSVLFLRDPFPVVNPANWLNLMLDPNTRVIILVRNLQLAQDETPASVVVHLIDSGNQTYDVAAEHVQILPGFDFAEVIFRLPETLSPGTCTMQVRAHGQASNSGSMTIRL